MSAIRLDLRQWGNVSVSQQRRQRPRFDTAGWLSERGQKAITPMTDIVAYKNFEIVRVSLPPLLQRHTERSAYGIAIAFWTVGINQQPTSTFACRAGKT